MSGRLWRVVVVDDSRRFATHVARFVLRRLAVGERRSLADEPGEHFAWLTSGGELLSDDGLGSFLWIDARHAQPEDLAAQAGWLQPRPPNGLVRRLIVLLDRRQELTRERVSELFARGGLTERVEIEVWSAYHAADEGIETVYSKSRANLERLRRRLDAIEGGREAKQVHEPSPVRHVLITGAGFEVADGEGSFGLPPTAQLLHDLDEPFIVPEDERAPEAERTVLIPALDRRGGFPCWWEDGSPPARSNSIGSLDEFWNSLLAAETQRVVRRLGRGMEGRAGAFNYEMRMRQAFRRILSQHDWGHVKQAVLAAQLDWLCWLTTNYTGFSDRAIDLSRKPWQIIATEIEAVNLVHEEPWTARYMAPYLFKLHGELQHLHSMAIAGWDKEPFSPLWFPVDKLSQIYTAAERFLEGCLDRRDDRPEAVLLHVVGHGLKDERLVRLIVRILGKADSVKAKYLVVLVGPSPAAIGETLVGRHKIDRDSVAEVKTSAAPYLSRLHRQSFDGIRSVKDWRAWLSTFEEEER